MKKYIILSIIILISISLYILFCKHNNANTILDNISNKENTNITVKNIANIKGKIILGDRAEYNNLSLCEKSIVNRFVKLYPLDENMLISSISIKYYDDSMFLIEYPSGKGPMYIIGYSITDFKQVTTNTISDWGNIYEDENYIIEPEDSGISFYKIGNKTISTIPNSEASSGKVFDKDQTYYTVSNDMQSKSSFGFEPNSKLLTVDVFKDNPLGGVPNTKIGEKTFILP